LLFARPPLALVPALFLPLTCHLEGPFPGTSGPPVPGTLSVNLSPVPTGTPKMFHFPFSCGLAPYFPASTFRLSFKPPPDFPLSPPSKEFVFVFSCLKWVFLPVFTAKIRKDFPPFPPGFLLERSLRFLFPFPLVSPRGLFFFSRPPPCHSRPNFFWVFFLFKPPFEGVGGLSLVLHFFRRCPLGFFSFFFLVWCIWSQLLSPPSPFFFFFSESLGCRDPPGLFSCVFRCSSS